MENKRTYILGILFIIGFMTILADVPQPMNVDEAELNALLKKSEEQLQKVTIIAKMVDNVATTHMEEMQESIEELQEVNEKLTTEIYEVKTAMESVTNSAVPFVLDPILSDTTN